MPVDPARAALVKEPYSRKTWTAASPLGGEETIVTALADDAGAQAWLARLASCVEAALARCTIVVRDVSLPLPWSVGDVIDVPADWSGPLAGRRALITGISLRLGERAATLTVRGPLP